jgi:hypothetical protein
MGKTLIVSTDGQAVMRSHDNGKSWYRINIGQDLEYDDRVRCLLVDPRNPDGIFAGAEKGCSTAPTAACTGAASTAR